MWTNIQYRILKCISPRRPDCRTESVYEGKSKLSILFGDDFLSKISGKTIVDFGCGEGVEAVEMAQRGAKRVIGIDIRENVLQTARRKAFTAGVQNICLFASSTRELAEIVVSIDAFEHFADPANPALHEYSPATDGRSAQQFWTNLVSSLGWTSVLCLPLGTSNVQRASSHPLEIHLQDRWGNAIQRGGWRSEPNDYREVRGVDRGQCLQARLSGTCTH